MQTHIFTLVFLQNLVQCSAAPQLLLSRVAPVTCPRKSNQQHCGRDCLKRMNSATVNSPTGGATTDTASYQVMASTIAMERTLVALLQPAPSPLTLAVQNCKYVTSFVQNRKGIVISIKQS